MVVAEGIGRLTIGVVQVTKLVVGEERPQHIAHVHVDIALAEGAASNFGRQIGYRWNGLRLEGHVTLWDDLRRILPAKVIPDRY